MALKSFDSFRKGTVPETTMSGANVGDADNQCFYGITIRMHWKDHVPPHFHAEFGGAEALIGILDVSVIREPTRRGATRGTTRSMFHCDPDPSRKPNKR
jgi:Domain of unknown function (DUF4160)